MYKDYANKKKWDGSLVILLSSNHLGLYINLPKLPTFGLVAPPPASFLHYSLCTTPSSLH